jgi:hypothetical protein
LTLPTVDDDLYEKNEGLFGDGDLARAPNVFEAKYWLPRMVALSTLAWVVVETGTPAAAGVVGKVGENGDFGCSEDEMNGLVFEWVVDSLAKGFPRSSSKGTGSVRVAFFGDEGLSALSGRSSSTVRLVIESVQKLHEWT